MPRRVLVGHQACDGRGMNGMGMEAAHGGRWREKSPPSIPSYNEIIVRAIQDPGGYPEGERNTGRGEIIALVDARLREGEGGKNTTAHDEISSSVRDVSTMPKMGAFFLAHWRVSSDALRNFLLAYFL